ncbi:VOC family protein [Phyllobacterium myrsinacearum]|uniref:Catechol 2,3-dioxygenase-like lactoylglutathione lyase family enzyme n=1 Tax=Phyllobacterium myrsinacearum TaxID=28101 RepID=A0A839ESX8_9HYPH|nr:VOC family protein [Phyllobacterium myrsinacearum]MBA8880624.1 catechol 2,3-dioxygenase-like lactoylglutathione lyase family enzyme [Phyllobacterium myrsinacearum]
MAITGINHIQLAMPQGKEQAAREFYHGLLGIPEVQKPEQLAARGGCWFQIGNVRIHLGVEQNFLPAKKAHPALLTDDLSALTRALEAAGYAITEDQPLERYDRRFVNDPFGNRIELMQIK